MLYMTTDTNTTAAAYTTEAMMMATAAAANTDSTANMAGMMWMVYGSRLRWTRPDRWSTASARVPRRHGRGTWTT